MPPGLQECLEDYLPLAGLFHVMTSDMGAQYLFFSFHRDSPKQVDAEKCSGARKDKDLSRGILFSMLRLKSEVLTPQMSIFQRQLTSLAHLNPRSSYLLSGFIGNL